MFTGIIEGVGIVKAVRRASADLSLEVNTGAYVENPVIGESVALNGVCLTVVTIKGPILTFDVSSETLSRTTFKNVKMGDKVNLERATKLGDRMGGHIVSGHIDTVATLTRCDAIGAGYEIEVSLPKTDMKYIIGKGSIAVDGMSLTVATKRENSFTVAVIPHTYNETRLNSLKPGSFVNIEYDMIAKYVENFVNTAVSSGSSINKEFLNKHGFGY
ncbi:Riboflavin synthase eubacterial/eukaryotic [hydrothermal vent metagenome]|uniref:Riboflavin synthase n=1 Tax=hydrothermal vent metagenome TaxID=652676 RepID=A0A3B1C7K2_9ZZZZ